MAVTHSEETSDLLNYMFLDQQQTSGLPIFRPRLHQGYMS